jgi:predicted transcriptional regulator
MHLAFVGYTSGGIMRIDILRQKAPEFLLMNALSKHYSDDELFNKLKLGNGSEIEVKLTVNGFEVTFDSIVQNIYDHCEQVHDDEVVEKAVRLLNLAGLDDMQDTIRNARERVEMSLEELIQKLGK